jgi:poly-gamma-glutamate capsule biosynthesis protein CapA/YwtB (metallophosphatase superfamily)
MDMGMSMGGGNMGGGSGGGANSPEVRKYAQSIVRQTVQQINHKADEIPDDVALMKEQELLQAVINELQNLR